MSTGIVTPFRTSSYSGQAGNCVEVAGTATGGSAVRDSKARGHGVQYFGRREWMDFVGLLKSGGFAG